MVKNPETGTNSLSASPQENLAGKTPDEKSRELNDLFSATFDSVLRIEEHALDNRLTEGLTISELHTIAAVGLYDAKPMNAIASALHVTLATVTTAVNKLERKGYVERERNPEDRRQVLVSLTNKGRKACRAHDMFHAKMVARALSSMTDSETDALMKALAHLVEFFNEEDAAAVKHLKAQRESVRLRPPAAAAG
ncbi:MAG: MarR family winged helix-turn-helix transcriptional regulator [Eggerthellaceae bacterium]|jgi:DNA-binding MarR family transcriptional regulator